MDSPSPMVPTITPSFVARRSSQSSSVTSATGEDDTSDNTPTSNGLHESGEEDAIMNDLLSTCSSQLAFTHSPLSCASSD